jgi:hypothetical protein
MNIKDYIISSEDRERIMGEAKKAYTPVFCDICGKPLSFEEHANLHLMCCTNPKNRFCGETVFCCNSHSFEECIDFVMARRAKRKLNVLEVPVIPVDNAVDKAIDEHFSDHIKTKKCSLL